MQLLKFIILWKSIYAGCLYVLVGFYDFDTSLHGEITLRIFCWCLLSHSVQLKRLLSIFFWQLIFQQCCRTTEDDSKYSPIGYRNVNYLLSLGAARWFEAFYWSSCLCSSPDLSARHQLSGISSSRWHQSERRLTTPICRKFIFSFTFNILDISCYSCTLKWNLRRFCWLRQNFQSKLE